MYTPHMANLDLWKTSGHADFYKNDMFNPITVQGKQPTTVDAVCRGVMHWCR